jgi:hypothetical protein
VQVRPQALRVGVLCNPLAECRQLVLEKLQQNAIEIRCQLLQSRPPKQSDPGDPSAQALDGVDVP